MNRKQKIVLWVGITIFVLMGLFPPTTVPELFARAVNGNRQRHTYRCFFQMSEREMELRKLLVQWSVIAVVTGGLFVTLKDNNDGKKPPAY